MILSVGEILADMIGKNENGVFSYERRAGGALMTRSRGAIDALPSLEEVLAVSKNTSITTTTQGSPSN